MVVHVEGFRGPEHEHGEEVCARNESDDQSQTQSARFLLYPCREHGILGAINLPKSEGHKQKETNNQWCENMSRGPGILQWRISTILLGTLD